MIGIVMMALGAATIAAFLGRLLLVEMPIRNVLVTQAVLPMPRKGVSPTRQQRRAVGASTDGVPAQRPKLAVPRLTVALKIPTITLRIPKFALPRVRRQGAAAAVVTQDVERGVATPRPRFRMPKFQIPAMPRPKLRSRSTSPAEAEEVLVVPPSTDSRAEVVTASAATAKPAVPGWLADLPEVPPVDRRVWLFWLRASAYVGAPRAEFLDLVEETDPELVAVVSLARQSTRPLVVRTLEDAQRWMQQNGAQGTSAA